MAKKKSSRTTALRIVKSDDSMGNNAPHGDQTSESLEQPVEPDVYPGEGIVVDDISPTTTDTSVDKAALAAREKSELQPRRPVISPYARDPVAIKVGPSQAAYWIPKHLLCSPHWSTVDAGGIICLPNVSAETAHTLVHYLYTGTYHALGVDKDDAAPPLHIKFRQALLTFSVASTYELHGLERLAREQIEIHGSQMTLVEVLETVEQDFPKISGSWFHEYLQSRAREQLDLDHTLFTDPAFIESWGEGTLHKFMTCRVLEIFSAKLTHALHATNAGSLDKRKSDASLNKVEDTAVQAQHCRYCHDGHQKGLHELIGKMPFESLNASCRDVDDAIPLETVSYSDCTVPESCVEEAEFDDPNEGQVIVTSAPTEVYEESFVVRSTESRRTGKNIAAPTAETVHDAEPTRAPEPESSEADDPWSFDFGNKTKFKKNQRGGAVEQESEPLCELPMELESAPEPACGIEEEPWAAIDTTCNKMEEPTIEESVQQTDPEPELQLTPLEPEPKLSTQEPTVDPFAGLSKSQKKKLQRKMEEEAKAREAELARVAEEAELSRVAEEEEELVRLEEEEAAAAAAAAEADVGMRADDSRGGWSFETSILLKNKKKVYGAEEESMLTLEEPEFDVVPEPAPEPEAPPEPEQELMHEPGLMPEEAVSEAIPESSGRLCPRRSRHLIEGNRWKSCKQCRAMLRDIAVQLAEKNSVDLLLGQ